MTQSAIEVLLKSKIGLEINSMHSGILARAMAQRMKDCGITDVEIYLQKLQISHQEWEALVEGVVVPETWFFREQESFQFLKHYLLSEWLPTYPNKVLRILSVPCSTGEEPYSIAMILLDIGLEAERIQIDAIDISRKNLLVAQEGIYSEYSFRGNLAPRYKFYFQSSANRYQLCQSVRTTVNFMQGNLVDPCFLASTAPYDIIFCRNLLIYFDSFYKERTIRLLERLLTPTGLLFLGHAETGLMFNTRFVPVRRPKVFAYRKGETVAKRSQIYRQKLAANKKNIDKHCVWNPTQYPVRTDKKIAFPTTWKEKPLEDSSTLLKNELKIAKNLANQGRLSEAAALCIDHIGSHPASAAAYVLLGEVQQAMGEHPKAKQSFQKAVYLQPNDEAALVHLALLQEHQGNGERAGLLWQRIHRLQQRREGYKQSQESTNEVDMKKTKKCKENE